MTFEEFKSTVLDSATISDGLKFAKPAWWRGRFLFPVCIIGMDNADSIVKIPQWYKLESGAITRVNSIIDNVLGSNANMTDLILPPSIERFTPQMLTACNKLKRMTFPKSVTCVPEKTFRDCIALEDVYYEGSREEWDRIDIVHRKDVAIVDHSRLGLLCNVDNVRYPIYGNEPLFNARIHFDCDLGCSGSIGELGVYLNCKPLSLK